MLNEIYESGNIPAELSKSIFIAFPKSPLRQNVSCTGQLASSHVVKILLRVLMRRTRNKTRPEISKLQCGFVEDSGTRNAIFMIRMLSERAIEMQRNLFLCFIDYSKAFDNVKHERLLEMLEDIQIDGKDLRIKEPVLEANSSYKNWWPGGRICINKERSKTRMRDVTRPIQPL